MRWIEALRKWNGERGGKWCVPRKDSADYAAVKKIMGGESPVEKEEVKPKMRRVVRKKREPAVVKTSSAEVVKKVRPVLKKKEVIAMIAEAVGESPAAVRKALSSLSSCQE